MNLTNRRLLSISNADARFVDCSWLRVSGLMHSRLNVFLKQNVCKHSQLCLKGLNGQDKPYYIKKKKKLEGLINFIFSIVPDHKSRLMLPLL